MIVVAVAALLMSAALVGVEAHLCILSPVQRGGYNVSTPGDDSCYRRTPYCGSTAPEAPTAAFVAGQQATVTFEQNLNHWFGAKPGFFDLALSYNAVNPSDSDFVPLAQFPDAAMMDMVQRTIFSVAVTFPAQACDHCILRARYVSHNPMEVDPANNTDVVFYNCADIRLVGGAAGKINSPVGLIVAAAPVTAPAGANTYECTTPPAWTARFTETNAWGVVEHTIWWDSVAKLTRWDKNGSLDATGPSAISLINDYTKPVEYVHFISRASCPAYGNDAFYDWAYTAANGMAYLGRTSAGVDAWGAAGDHAGERQYSWTTKPLGSGLCQPLGWTRGQASVNVVDFSAGAISPAVFTPDPLCLKSAIAKPCASSARDD